MTITTIGLDLAKIVFQAAAGEAASSQADAVIPFEVVAVPDRDGGLWNGPLLGPHAGCHGARGPSHSILVREGLCQARQERCVRRRGDLRSRATPDGCALCR